jgi:hypothetical protein
MTGSSDGLKRGEVVGIAAGSASPARAKAVISALVAFLAILAPSAIAAEETITLGGYQVSFDLGNYTGYSFEFEEVPYATVDGEEYNTEICWIRYDGGFTMIAINDYAAPIEATQSLTRSLVVDFLNNRECTSINTEMVRIENKPGILGMCLSPSGSFIACIIFWPDMRDVNGSLFANVDCVIYSEYSESSVALTEKLLNSIRVRPTGDEEAVGVRMESDRIVL